MPVEIFVVSYVVLFVDNYIYKLEQLYIYILNADTTI